MNHEKNSKPRIFCIGGTGLVGSRIIELLKDSYEIINLSRETGVDIRNPQTLEQLKNDTSDAFVILLAAKTDVDSCENDKTLGKEGETWKINVEGTQNIINACKNGNKKLIYISTDFVFGGNDPVSGGFTEEDIPSPVNWYGVTKYEGEKLVANSGLPYIFARIAYPYRETFPQKKDFVRAIREKLQSGLSVSAITDHIMTPTFIDDIAHALDKLIANSQSGIYHVVGSQFVSPYEAAGLIAHAFGLNSSLISKTTKEEFFKNKAPRPFNLSLKNDKIQRLGVKMKSFEEGLFSLK